LVQVLVVVVISLATIAWKPVLTIVVLAIYVIILDIMYVEALVGIVNIQLMIVIIMTAGMILALHIVVARVFNSALVKINNIKIIIVLMEVVPIR
jgi:hypothetical protein